MKIKKQNILEDLNKMSYMMGFDASKTPTENKIITENLLTIPEKKSNVKNLVENAVIRNLVRGTKYGKGVGRLLKGVNGIFGPMKTLKGMKAVNGGEKLMANMSKASRQRLVTALSKKGATQANLSTKLVQNMDSPAILKILKGESRMSKQLQNNLYYFYKANPRLMKNLPKEFQTAIKANKQTIVPIRNVKVTPNPKVKTTVPKTGPKPTPVIDSITKKIKDILKGTGGTAKVIKQPVSVGMRVFKLAKTVFKWFVGWWVIKWAVVIGVGWLAFDFVKEWLEGGRELTPEEKMQCGLQSAFAAGFDVELNNPESTLENPPDVTHISENEAKLLGEKLVANPLSMPEIITKYGLKSLLDTSMVCKHWFEEIGTEYYAFVIASEKATQEEDSDAVNGLYNTLLPIMTPLCFAIIGGVCCQTKDDMMAALGIEGPEGEGGEEGEAAGQFSEYPCVLNSMKKYKGVMKQTSMGTAFVKIVIDGRTGFFLPDGTAQIEDLGGGKNLRGTYSCKGVSTVEFEESKLHEGLASLLNEEEIAFGDMVISVGGGTGPDDDGPAYDETSDDGRDNYASDDGNETTSISRYRNCTTFPLQKFCKGTKVKELQDLLIGAGFSVGAKGADGMFGPDTLAGVKAAQKGTAYQKDNGVVTEDFFVSLKGGGTVAATTEVKPTATEKKDEEVGAEVQITKGNTGSKITAGDQLVQDTVDGVDVVKGPGGTEYATTDDIEKIKYTKQGNIKTIKTEYQIVKFDKKTGKVKSVRDRRTFWGRKKKRK